MYSDKMINQIYYEKLNSLNTRYRIQRDLKYAVSENWILFISATKVIVNLWLSLRGSLNAAPNATNAQHFFAWNTFHRRYAVQNKLETLCAPTKRQRIDWIVINSTTTTKNPLLFG